MRFIIAAMVVLTASIATANTDCFHDGVAYPPGTILGPLVCMPDGTWKIKK